jgi:hypothetical protein
MSATHRPPSPHRTQGPTPFDAPTTETGHASDGARPCPAGPFRAHECDTVRRALHPLLRRFLEVGRDGLLAVRSPWCFQLPLVDVALANAGCSRRNALVHEALTKGDVPGALIHIERPYRLNVLDVVREAVGLSPLQVREGLAFAWPTLELVYPVAHEGLRLLKRVGFITDAPEVADVGAGEPRDTTGRDDRADNAAAREGDTAAGPAVASSRVSTTRPAWLADTTCEVTIYRGASSPKHVGPCWSRDREGRRVVRPSVPSTPLLIRS